MSHNRERSVERTVGSYVTAAKGPLKGSLGRPLSLMTSQKIRQKDP